jgi:hypothetical protein
MGSQFNRHRISTFFLPGGFYFIIIYLKKTIIREKTYQLNREVFLGAKNKPAGSSKSIWG